MTKKTVTTNGFALNYFVVKLEDIEKTLPTLIPKRKDVVWYVTEHWTAGAYNHGYTHYQILIGTDYILVSPDLFRWGWHGHTWRRNSYNIGISYMGMASASFPITHQMMEMSAKVKAVLKEALGLQWSQFKDHDYFSKVDGYDSLRWDTQLMLKDAEARSLGLSQESLFSRGIRYAKSYVQKGINPTMINEEPKQLPKLYPQLTGTPFKDVDPTRYSAEAIVYTYQNGLLSGHKTNFGIEFKPTEPVSREQLAVALKKLMEKSGQAKKETSDTEHPFYDVARILGEEGIINAKGHDQAGNPFFGLHEKMDFGTVIAAIVAIASKDENVLINITKKIKELGA